MMGILPRTLRSKNGWCSIMFLSFKQEKYVQLIASQCRTRGNLGAKIFEGMFAAVPSFASTAAAAVFSLDHASCKDITSRYLAAFLNDMTRSAGLVQEMIDGSEEHLQVRLTIML